jgi:hypothetical protein
VAVADLIGLTFAQRFDLADLMGSAVDSAKAGHSEVRRMSLAGSSGFAAIVVRSVPRQVNRIAAAYHLRADLDSVMGDWGCDRATELGIGPNGSVTVIGFKSTAIEPSIAALRAVAVPPSARKPKRPRR